MLSVRLSSNDAVFAVLLDLVADCKCTSIGILDSIGLLHHELATVHTHLSTVVASTPLTFGMLSPHSNTVERIEHAVALTHQRSAPRSDPRPGNSGSGNVDKRPVEANGV